MKKQENLGLIALMAAVAYLATFAINHAGESLAIGIVGAVMLVVSVICGVGLILLICLPYLRDIK